MSGILKNFLKQKQLENEIRLSTVPSVKLSSGIKVYRRGDIDKSYSNISGINEAKLDVLDSKISERTSHDSDSSDEEEETNSSFFGDDIQENIESASSSSILSSAEITNKLRSLGHPILYETSYFAINNRLVFLVKELIKDY